MSKEGKGHDLQRCESTLDGYLMIDKQTQKAVDMFYSIYFEFYKKCGDRNTAIQLTCALCGVKVPELETFSFLFGNNGCKRNK